MDRHTWDQLIDRAEAHYHRDLEARSPIGRQSEVATEIDQLIQDHVALFALELRAVGRELLP